jgi:hypothetical protein
MGDETEQPTQRTPGPADGPSTAGLDPAGHPPREADAGSVREAHLIARPDNRISSGCRWV